MAYEVSFNTAKRLETGKEMDLSCYLMYRRLDRNTMNVNNWVCFCLFLGQTSDKTEKQSRLKSLFRCRIRVLFRGTLLGNVERSEAFLSSAPSHSSEWLLLRLTTGACPKPVVIYITRHIIWSRYVWNVMQLRGDTFFLLQKKSSSFASFLYQKLLLFPWGFGEESRKWPMPTQFLIIWWPIWFKSLTIIWSFIQGHSDGRVNLFSNYLQDFRNCDCTCYSPVTETCPVLHQFAGCRVTIRH